MLNPQPKEKIVEIIDHLLSLQVHQNVNSLELARAKQEVKRLIDGRNSNLAQCHTALGLIACYLNRREEAEFHQKNASLLEPGDSVHLVNYAITCTDFGSFDETIAATNDLVNRFGNLKSAIFVAFRQMINLLQIDKAEAYLAIYQNMVLNDSADDTQENFGKFLRLIRQTYSEYKVSDAHVLDLLKTAVSTVRTLGHDVLSTGSQYLSSGEILYYLYIDAEIDTCVERNFDIADALVSKFEDSGMDYLSIVCRSIKHVDRSTLKMA